MKHDLKRVLKYRARNLNPSAAPIDRDGYSLERKIHCILLQSNTREMHMFTGNLKIYRMRQAVRNFGGLCGSS